jgi:phenylpropionate dioxygenase-like ring-hydroxylating dioxygenase large terminal subunit
MRRQERLRLLRILKDGLANGGAVHGEGIVESPLSDFTCPDLLAEEQRVFFRETPLFMGLSADLPENGSYWADSETGLPILMTRDDAGEFRAFANTCRHRGAQVVPDGRGHQPRFSCPFHAWTYSNRGDLIAVNRAERFGDFDKAGRGLIELPSAEKYGMLWVRPTPGDEIDVDVALGGLEDDMAHWELPEHSYGASQIIPANVNWKLAVDTFGENYHFDVLHRETLANDIRGNLQTHDTFGPNYRMVFAYNRFPEVAKAVPDPKQWPFRVMTLSVYFIYPNTIFLVDPYAVDVLRIFPDAEDPAKSTTAHSYYVLPEVKAHFEDPAHPERSYEDRFEGFNHVIVNEDYRMAESTQRCADAGIQSHILFGRNEPALLHYHNAHRRGLGRPLLEAMPG